MKIYINSEKLLSFTFRRRNINPYEDAWEKYSDYRKRLSDHLNNTKDPTKRAELIHAIFNVSRRIRECADLMEKYKDVNFVIEE
jgi:hypothetical protein